MQRSRVLRLYTCVCLPRFNSGGGYNGGAGRFDPYGELFIATIHHFLPIFYYLRERLCPATVFLPVLPSAITTGSWLYKK